MIILMLLLMFNLLLMVINYKKKYYKVSMLSAFAVGMVFVRLIEEINKRL